MRVILCLLLFVSAGVAAQNIDSTKVPGVIRHTYDSIYSSLKNPAWQFNTDSLYIASVYMEGLSKKVYFSKEGRLKRVVSDLPVSRTPQYIKDSLDHRYNKNYQLLSITADVKYASIAYRDKDTHELKGMRDYKLLDYTIKITSGGKIYNLNYNYNSHELMEE